MCWSLGVQEDPDDVGLRVPDPGDAALGPPGVDLAVHVVRPGVA